jgi:predicted  nucleic acid-binding Zn-ribbon protein
MTDNELRQLIGAWLEVTRRRLAIYEEQSNVRDRYDRIEYPEEIVTLDELLPYQLEMARLQERHQALGRELARLDNSYYDLGEQIRKALPPGTWYRYNGVRVGWERERDPILQYEEVEHETVNS